MTVSLEPCHDPDQFNSVVGALPISSPLQAWGYGEARQALGAEPMRFVIRKGAATVGAVQLLRRRLLPGLSTLYAPRGPALESMDLLPELAQPLKQLAKATDTVLKVEPPLPVPAATGDVTNPTEMVADQRDVVEAYGAFRRAKTEQPEHTIMADLTGTEEEMFAGLHKMARRNVRTAAKMGVQARRDESFADFWQIFDETNQRAQLGSFPRSYYETLLREGNRHGSQAYLVLSRHEGRALAGGFFLGLGSTTAYLFGGSIRDDRPPAPGQDKRKDAKAPDAFYWNAMLDAKAHGYSTFDFWGIPRILDESKHSFGVFKMKLKFSTDRYWFPAYDLKLSPLATPLTQVKELRRRYLNYRSRGTTDDIL